MATATLSGQWNLGALQFTPSASLGYIKDRSEKYRNALGVDIPEVEASLGQFKAGPEFSYRYDITKDLTIQPRVAFEIVWNFAESSIESLTTDTVPDELRGRIELGVSTSSSSGLRLDFAGIYDGLGSEYRSIGGSASVRIPLN